MSRSQTLRPQPRPDETPCDYLLRCFEDTLREMYLSTANDGKERSVTVFSTPDGRWGVTDVRVGGDDYVVTQPAPDPAREHIEIHTHPPSHPATLSTSDWETFGYHIVRGEPYADIGGLRGYAVVGGHAPGVDAGRDTAVLRALTLNSDGRGLGPVDRRDVVRALSTSENAERSREIIEPISFECVSTFRVGPNRAPETKDALSRVHETLRDLATDAGLLPEDGKGEPTQEDVRREIEQRMG